MTSRGLDHPIDALDERILDALAVDARRSLASIGADVGLSAPAVKRRIDRLRASGVITGFTVLIDPQLRGSTTEAYVEVWCAQASSPRYIAEIAGRHSEVVSAMTVTGSADALLHVRATSIQHFEQVLEQIRAEPSVSRTRSSLVLSRTVYRDAEGHATLRT